MVSKKKLNKEIEDLRHKLLMQNMSIVNIGMEKRDMFMSPNEFILSRNQEGWKDIKISLKGKDIKKNATKIILFGPSLI